MGKVHVYYTLIMIIITHRYMIAYKKNGFLPLSQSKYQPCRCCCSTDPGGSPSEKMINSVTLEFDDFLMHLIALTCSILHSLLEAISEEHGSHVGKSVVIFYQHE